MNRPVENQVDIITVLERFGRLEWFEVTPSRDAPDEQRRFPPLVAWRFKKPNEHFEGAIEQVLKMSKGGVEWELSLRDGTWYLLPKRVAELQRAEQRLNITECILRLGNTDPDFGRKAHSELAGVVDAILQIAPAK